MPFTEVHFVTINAQKVSSFWKYLKLCQNPEFYLDSKGLFFINVLDSFRPDLDPKHWCLRITYFQPLQENSPESIEWLIDDQAILRSYDSAPRPPPSTPPLRQQVVSLSQSSCVLPVKLTEEGEAVGCGRGAKSNDREKAWSSINHSMLSGTVSPGSAMNH